MNASPKSRRCAPAHQPQQAELNEATSGVEPQPDPSFTPDPPPAPANDAQPEVILAIESQTTTALALVTQHVSAIQAFSAGVADLERQYVGVIFPVETTAGMKDACKAREVIREPRYAIQNLAKEAKSTLNNLKNEVDQQAESYIARIAAIEGPIHEQIVNENNRKAAEKKAKDEAEAQRKAVIEERINNMREAVALIAGRPAADIAIAIGDIESVVVDQTFAEFQPRAEAAKAATLMRLKGLHTAAVTLEAEQKRLQEVREQLDREKAEQDAAAAKERERIAEEQRVARQAATAEAARQAEVLRKQREAQEAESARIRAQQEAEEQRIAEDRAQLARDQAALRAQQEAAAAPAPAPAPVPDVPEPEAEAPVPAVATDTEFAYIKPPRPSDAAIVEMLVRSFSVDRDTVLEWLCDMDLSELVRGAA